VRYWSLLFLIIAALVVLCFLYAPFDPAWWLPPNLSTRTALHIAADVDHLFLIILWITGGVFIGTEAALCWTLWRYPTDLNRKAAHRHGSQRLEVIWTILTAAILVFIALYQMGAWTAIKFRANQPKVEPLADVTARQFQWKVRYPGPDGRLGTADDLHTTNDLRFVKDRAVVINLRSEDVIHSFYLPEMRIKQDALPGLTIPVWFDSQEAGRFDLVCAELCGWGHTKMRGQVTIYDTQEEFDEWMKEALREQGRSQLKPTAASTQTAAATTGEN
jgi:cytochrome c oxidase subunit 2